MMMRTVLSARKGLGIGLGQGYKNLIPIDSFVHSLSAKGVKSKCACMQRELNKPVVELLSEREFDKKFKNDYSDDEVGYATTKIYPNDEVHIYVKDSGNYERNGLLLMHELKELELWKKLVNNKCIDPNVADEMAHNMNPVKIEGVMNTYQINANN